MSEPQAGQPPKAVTPMSEPQASDQTSTVPCEAGQPPKAVTR